MQARVDRFGRIVTLRIVTADRGYGEAEVDRQLTDLGVKNVAIPRTTRPTQARRADEHRKASAAPSNGAPAAKVGSATSDATVGTAPASTASRAPGSGPDTASSPAEYQTDSESSSAH